MARVVALRTSLMLASMALLLLSGGPQHDRFVSGGTNLSILPTSVESMQLYYAVLQFCDGCSPHMASYKPLPATSAGRTGISVASAATVLPATQKALIQFMQQFAGPGLSSLVPPPEQHDSLPPQANGTRSAAAGADARQVTPVRADTGDLAADLLAAVGRRQKIPLRHPVILVPPLAGVLLERKLDHR
jgi:hypothetical protein